MNEELNKKENNIGENLIVGLGASAGGVEVLQQLFSCIPDKCGLSFVVVQHLSPDYKSLMVDILGKTTSMKVCQAAENMAVLPDTVYLIPPKKYIKIKNRRLVLTEMQHGALNRPVDVFFTSLAEDEKEHAIGVVLSGTGSDGANGVKRIKENGGMVIVQDPKSAKFDGMPLNSINTGVADFILPPEEIVDEILNFSKSPALLFNDRRKERAEEDALTFSEEENLSYIYTILKNASGIDFSYYKRSTILRRIERRMIVTHTSTLAEFAKFLGNNEDEVNILIKEILIGVTSFFRDPGFFEELKYNVIYKIVGKAKENDTIRIWSAGCSTGEEAYSIAILFREVMEELQVKRDVKIFATDAYHGSIEQAGKGIYAENIVDDVNPDRLSKYFSKHGDFYHVSKEIRRMIIFAPHNMFSDPPFGKLDMIVCRNVMIYFQPILRKGLFSIFHSALKNNGYLFLGKSETANEFSNVFKPVCSSEKIYIHKGEGKMDNISPFTFTVPNIQVVEQKEHFAESNEMVQRMEDESYTRYMEKLLPASVVIDPDNNVLHFFGNYFDYLTLAPGRATLNLFNMLNTDLSLAVSTALSKSRIERKPVMYKGIVVDCPAGRKIIDLKVDPIPEDFENLKELNAVIFLEHNSAQEEGIVEKYDINETAAQRITDLEREFQASQNDLRATIQRLETVNGELQAANEELLTANEELQSSTEELQSVNEELYTVNTEHQLKLDELTMLTNDLSNFLSSTLIGILFVDSDLNIRKFTEYVGREFQLMDHDIGRPIQIFAHSFPEEEIEEDCYNVLKKLVSIDREVTAMNGRCYTLRIAPYRTTENSIRGLVITIIDSLGSDRPSGGGGGEFKGKSRSVKNKTHGAEIKKERKLYKPPVS